MKLRTMTTAALFAALTAILSQIAVPLPFTPVPVTLQSLAVFLTAVILGSKRGALAIVLYTLMGLVGLPVFAQGEAGLGVLLGPKGGYIFGFILAAFIIGRIAEKTKELSYIKIFGSMVVGMIIYYVIGWVQIKFVLDISFKEAFSIGVVPFIPFDLIKIVCGAYIGCAVRKAVANVYPNWVY
ncbi:MAG: biotin transporter BioY [Desulfitobacteriaceae bacterium]|nr:biotin transporter BioY [Desulfitobacteriaceae bacterium]MDD4752433.1 biotin transporter BioY [Desulfitobacteriaceae bacterium]